MILMLSIEEECIPISFVIVIKFTQEDGFDWQIGYDGCSLEGNESSIRCFGVIQTIFGIQVPIFFRKFADDHIFERIPVAQWQNL